jgi:hypothetical protein
LPDPTGASLTIADGNDTDASNLLIDIFGGIMMFPV